MHPNVAWKANGSNPKHQSYKISLPIWLYGPPTRLVLEAVYSTLYPIVSETISVPYEITHIRGNGCTNTVLAQILACVFTTVTLTTLATQLLNTLL